MRRWKKSWIFWVKEVFSLKNWVEQRIKILAQIGRFGHNFDKYDQN